MRTIRNADVPVIAAVDGLAAAAGCQLVAACDIVVATKTSTFSTPGANFGLFCSTPGIPLARSVPRKISALMLFTGNAINAEEALQFGLVSRLAEKGDLDIEVEAVCEAIKAKPKAVIALGKKFLNEQLEMKYLDALESGSKVMVDNLQLVDAQEGISAFKEKRKPFWTHTDY